MYSSVQKQFALQVKSEVLTKNVNKKQGFSFGKKYASQKTVCVFKNMHEDEQKKCTSKQYVLVPKTGAIHLAARREYDNLFRVGKHWQNASPCVDVASVDKTHSLVYEEWIRHEKTVFSEHFRCRCFKIRGDYVVSGNRKRAHNTKRGYLGCNCKARFTVRHNTDGSYKVTFKGTHNHDVQNEYAMNFMNPLKVCRNVREMMNEKLYNGVHKSSTVRASAHEDMLLTRREHKSFRQ